MLKAFLVGANLQEDNFEFSMKELSNLAEAMDYEVIGEMTQNLSSVNKSFYIGEGKVEELKRAVKELSPDTVIFDNELSPSQYSHLSEKLELKILDRTSLILEIFALRAKTHEAKLQVEVAKLKYELPRLVNKDNKLSQQGGGSGVKNKGEGEKQIDLDRYQIKKKINELEKQLETLVKTRVQQRKKRKKSEIPTVALVGYTNAGKSTLMNRFLEFSKNTPHNKEVLSKNMLFATLDTQVRKIKFEDNKEILLSDTVGFINKLPSNLIKAFRSTLEEALNADLLLNIIDLSDPNYELQYEVTINTLKEIGAGDIEIINVFNKYDLVKNELVANSNDTAIISCKNLDGFDRLINLIYARLFLDYEQVMMHIPYEESALYSYFCEHAEIFLKIEDEKGMLLNMECHKKDKEKYKQYLV